MATMKLVTNNLITSGCTITVSSENALFLKANAYDKTQAVPWWATSKTAISYKVDATAAIAPDVAGIMNHNMVGTSVGGTFLCKIKAAAADPPAGGDWDSPDAEWAFTHNDPSMFKELSGSPSYRYWVFDIDDFDNSGYVRIGQLILGNVTTWSHRYLVPHGQGLRYIIKTLETSHGVLWPTKKALQKAYELPFSHFTDAQIRSDPEAFLAAIDGVDPFLFIPNSDEAYCWYMHCLAEGLAMAANNYVNNNAFSLEMLEQARGQFLIDS